LLKKSIAPKDHPAAVVGEAIKSVGALGEKELLGAEKALNEFRDSIKGKRDTSPPSRSKQAMEEEFVPVVSCLLPRQ
jgi:hypothetical protein